MVTVADFEKAAEDSRKLVKKPNNDELLELYGLFKVAKAEDFSKAVAPGLFDIRNKAKYNSWKGYVDEGLTAESAQERYVALVEKLKVTYGYDANKVPEKTGSD
ncbi:Acyl-CoA-bindinghomolog-like protein [Cladobotryum mycophilum]|uniref:Acyl-CoA-bindinghomolog-like protein n=1 Tax=Cladobotryum mycophilum TaxID=491253 RepID=A0ABR0T3L0_9HYPO